MRLHFITSLPSFNIEIGAINRAFRIQNSNEIHEWFSFALWGKWLASILKSTQTAVERRWITVGHSEPFCYYFAPRRSVRIFQCQLTRWFTAQQKSIRSYPKEGWRWPREFWKRDRKREKGRQTDRMRDKAPIKKKCNKKRVGIVDSDINDPSPLPS